MSSNVRRQWPIRVWHGSFTYVVADWLGVCCIKFGKVENKWKSGNPHGDKMAPKVIIDSCWIFDPKYEQLLNNDEGIIKQQKFCLVTVLHHHLAKTYKTWRASNYKGYCFNDLQNRKVLDKCPALWCHKLIDECSFIVSSISFIPNYAVKESNNKRRCCKWEKDWQYLWHLVAVKFIKRIMIVMGSVHVGKV